MSFNFDSVRTRFHCNEDRRKVLSCTKYLKMRHNTDLLSSHTLSVPTSRTIASLIKKEIALGFSNDMLVTQFDQNIRILCMMWVSWKLMPALAAAISYCLLNIADMKERVIFNVWLSLTAVSTKIASQQTINLHVSRPVKQFVFQAMDYMLRRGFRKQLLGTFVIIHDEYFIGITKWFIQQFQKQWYVKKFNWLIQAKLLLLQYNKLICKQ